MQLVQRGSSGYAWESPMGGDHVSLPLDSVITGHNAKNCAVSLRFGGKHRHTEGG